MPADRERRLHSVPQLLGDLGGLFARLEIRQHHDEFVASGPRQGIVAAQAALEPIGHRLEQSIADQVAQLVINGLEMVQVQEQQRRPPAVAVSRGERHFPAVF